jgi:hypothetical protein
MNWNEKSGPSAKSWVAGGKRRRLLRNVVYIMRDVYILKLLWMSLASFFLLHLAMGLMVWAVTPAAIRAAGRMRASSAARFLLAVRFLPCAFASLAVAALCVPSYLWLEPGEASEELSIPCFAAAALCVAIWTISIARGARAVARSLRYLGECRNSARELDLPACPLTGWVTNGGGHSIGLAGIFRPRVIVGRDILGVLSPEQLDSAIRHECAHSASRDNLKKLMIHLVPDVLPFVRARFTDVDRSWARFAEWAADDRAAAGDARRSLSLAGALVAVARMGIPAPTVPLMTSLVAQPGELSVRVHRLLEPRPDSGDSSWRMPLVGAGVALAALFIAMFAAIKFGPLTLAAVHELLENWMR